MGSAHSVWTTLGLPPLRACVLSQPTLLRLQPALQGNCPRWACVSCSSQAQAAQVQVLGHSTKAQTRLGPVFHALPRPKLLRLRFRLSGSPQMHRLGLCSSQVQAAQGTSCLVSTLSQAVCCQGTFNFKESYMSFSVSQGPSVLCQFLEYRKEQSRMQFSGLRS